MVWNPIAGTFFLVHFDQLVGVVFRVFDSAEIHGKTISSEVIEFLGVVEGVKISLHPQMFRLSLYNSKPSPAVATWVQTRFQALSAAEKIDELKHSSLMWV